MEINTIHIIGGSYIDVKKALQHWIELYSESIPESFRFELYKNGKGNHIIKADPKLDNEHFYYLVNYLNYPEGIEYNIDIEGFTKGQNNGDFSEKKIVVYISNNDSEYDNVYAVTEENKHFKIDFDGNVTSTSDTKSFSFFNIDDLKTPQILKVTSKKNNTKRPKDSHKKIEIRFIVISMIAITIALLNLLVPILSTDIEVFEQSTILVSICFGIWFLCDYEMLRINHYYRKSLLIAISYWGYGYYLCNYYRPEITDAIETTALFPLSLLIVQWPTRRVYKMIFNREPVVQRNGKFADVVYSTILLCGLVILPFLLIDYLKFLQG